MGDNHYSLEIGFQFAVSHYARSIKIYFTFPLSDFKQNWITLVGNNIIFPGNSTVRYFLKISTTSNNAPSLNYVYDKNILSPFPPYLFKSLDPSNTDRQIWLDSYNKENQGLINHDVYKNNSKTQYLVLKQARKILKSIHSMFLLVVKNDKDGKPLCENSHNVVLGKFKEIFYQKSQR